MAKIEFTDEERESIIAARTACIKIIRDYFDAILDGDLGKAREIATSFTQAFQESGMGDLTVNEWTEAIEDSFDELEEEYPDDEEEGP